MKNKEEIKYRVVITTNTFALNFDKEICAYVTGQIGECKTGVDRQYKASSYARGLFEKSMERRMCDDNLWRPVAISESDSNAFELFFKDKPTEEMMEFIKEGCGDFADEKKQKYPITTKIEFKKFVIIKERTLYEETEEISFKMPEKISN